MRKIIDAEETLEDMFMQFGCNKVFKKNGDFTKDALKNYYDKVMAWFCKKYNTTEYDFDEYVNEIMELGF